VLDFAAVSGACGEQAFKSRIFFSAGKNPLLTLRLRKADDPLKLAGQLVSVYASYRLSSAEKSVES